MRLLAFAFFAACAASAQDNPAPWSVRVWKEADGLPNDRLLAIGQTPDGFLWTATADMLARFDGSRFDTLSAERIGLESWQRIHGMLVGRHGTIYLSADRGVVLGLRDGQRTVLAHDLSTGWGDILAEDADGGVWVSFRNGSAFRILNGQATPVATEPRLRYTPRIQLSMDGVGNLWGFRDGAIGIYKDVTFEPIATVPNETTFLAGRRKGGVWVCNASKLYQLSVGHPLTEVASLPESNLREAPEAMLEDSKGAVWMGTTVSGLWRYEDGRISTIPTSHREISGLAEDREGNLWAATLGGGLDMIQPRTVHLDGSEVSLASESLLSVAEAPDRSFWGVTQDGDLARRDGDRWTHVLGRSTGLKEEATCLAIGSDGEIWIGTKFYRLYRWSHGVLTSWGQSDGILSHTIRALVVSSAGDLWIAGEGPAAIQCLRSGKLVNIPVPAHAMNLRCMVQDAEGTLWVGGLGQLLLQVKNDVLANCTPGEAVRGNQIQVRALRPLSDGSLLIGYNQGGAEWYKDGRYRRIGVQEGMTSDSISMIEPDGLGWLWIAGDGALFKVREADILAFAQGTKSRVEPVSYAGDREFRITRPIMGDVPPGVLHDHDGRMWIPTATAMMVVNPDIQREQAGPPPVYVTRVAADGTPLASYQGGSAGFEGSPMRGVGAVDVPAGSRRVDLAFTALSLGAPENVHFSYRLEPYDDRWTDGDSRREVTYLQLPPGRYTFRVRASSSDGIWNQDGATLSLVMRPFLWQTWWFRAAVILTGSLALVGAGRLVASRRLRRQVHLLEQQSLVDQERARIARDIHDDLGSRLTKIVLLTGLVARDKTSPEKAGQRNWEISETARQMIKSLDETIWTVNPVNDTVAHLIDYLGQYAVGFLRTAEVLCHVDLPSNFQDGPLAATVRHHVFLAVKEALNNIVRHAEASAAWLKIQVGRTEMVIEVEDNGQGFTPGQQAADSDGLSNIEQRMAQVGGSFRVQSTPGTGTRITLTIPLAAKAL